MIRDEAEAVNYGLALMNGGVAVELHVFPGTSHGFDSLPPDLLPDLLPDWETSERLFELQGPALRRALDPVASHGQSAI